jgi:hypothetical protein
MPINRTSAWGLLGLNQTSMTITANEIKSLVENPITLISGPGSKSFNAILHIAVISNFGTVPFLSPSVSSFVGAKIVYNGPSMWPATASASDLHNVILGASAGGSVVSGGLGGGGIGSDQGSPLSEVLGRDIIITNVTSVRADTPSDYVGGDGSLKITVLFTTINVY